MKKIFFALSLLILLSFASTESNAINTDIHIAEIWQMVLDKDHQVIELKTLYSSSLDEANACLFEPEARFFSSFDANCFDSNFQNASTYATQLVELKKELADLLEYYESLKIRMN